MMGLIRNIAGRSLVIGTLIGGYLLASPGAGHADRVYYKNGKFIQGIIKEEFPTRVEIVFEGRVLSIPRSRIERLEFESSEANLQSILAKVEEALLREDPDEAREHIESARALDSGGEFQDEIRGFELQLEQLATHGTSKQRREAAEKLLAQARDQIDRIQIEKGLELLLKSLETDPSYIPAHELMARQLETIIPPPVQLAIDYFSDFVDPEQIQANHPFVSFAAPALVELRRDLAEAATEEDIQQETQRIRKLTHLLNEHPDWNYNASPSQLSVMSRTFEELVTDQIDKDLDQGNYETAELRVSAWEEVQPEASDIRKYYVRAWVGMGELERAKATMSQMIGQPLTPEWAKLSYNALTNYETAVDALKWGQDRQAEGLLGTLLTLKGQLLKEVYQLIADTKFKHDEPQILNLAQRGDPSGAADIALRVYDYSIDEDMTLKARSYFRDLAPLIAFKPTFRWILDGIEIPLRQDSTDILKTHFGSEYGLRFSDISPFGMEIRLVNYTYDGTGEDLLAQIENPKAYTIDLYESDDFVVEMDIQITVSHPVSESLFSVSVEQPDLPKGRKYGSKNPTLGTIYFPLVQHNSVEKFVQDDFLKYLPEEMEEVYESLELPEKEDSY